MPLWMFRKPTHDFGDQLKNTAKQLYAGEQIECKMKVYGIHDNTGILNLKCNENTTPKTIEELMFCYRLFCKQAMYQSNIIGVERIYLAPWANHFQIRRWPNIKEEIPDTRNQMRKSATITMMNLMKTYIDEC